MCATAVCAAFNLIFSICMWIIEKPEARSSVTTKMWKPAFSVCMKQSVSSVTETFKGSLPWDIPMFYNNICLCCMQAVTILQKQRCKEKQFVVFDLTQILCVCV
ncbi:hypothetical protein ILYODFUR_028872 [Ilyodon furcidens]|uniref:Secreted protein n=1 Tax=Ilyodon furcidens TaxID=33524 RepID=A0ABV0TMK0_9TELE